MKTAVTQEYVDCLVSYLRDGHTYKQAGNAFNIRYDSVCKILKENNITKYDIKHGLLPQSFSTNQTEAIIGTMLGDAYITKNGHYVFKQKEASKQYVEWVKCQLSPFSGEVKLVKSTCNNKTYTQYYFYTPALKIFKSLKSQWYQSGKKQLPPNIKLTPRIIAIWFCDDGSNHQKRKQAQFSTECFTTEEVIYLISELSKFNIKANIKPTKSGPVIRVSKKSYYDLINLIKPYIPCECMAYKADTSKCPPPFKYVIDDETIEKIITLYQTGNYTMRQLGTMFNIDSGRVCQIIHKKYKNRKTRQ